MLVSEGSEERFADVEGTEERRVDISVAGNVELRWTSVSEQTQRPKPRAANVGSGTAIG